MALTKEKKQKIIEELKEKIARQKTMIFINFTGLKVKDFSNLRKELKIKDCHLMVAKKTLIGIVFKEAKIKAEIKNLPGEVALTFSYKNPLILPKIIYQFAETNPNLKILGGFLENKPINTEEIIELAKLPEKEELLGKLIGNLSAPILNLMNVLQGNLRSFIYLLSQIKVAKE